MILTAARIREEVEAERILLDPFDPAQLNPNSYNVRLSEELHVYTDAQLDARKAHETRVLRIPAAGVVLEPGELYLGATMERVGSEQYVPMLFGRSSIARLGLFVQITAPLGDLGYAGVWTLQLHATRPLRVYAGVAIAQILFLQADGPRDMYAGKYQGATGPRASELWRHFADHEGAAPEGTS